MTYQEAREYLRHVSARGSVLGLENIRNLLNRLGNPQEQVPMVHIAGTNGKGSVLTFLSSILEEAGYLTGTYSSPSVFSYLEMIQVNHNSIAEEAFADIVSCVKEAADKMEAECGQYPTIFELETASAFLYFQRQGCDVAVIECGLGGRLDATNIITRPVMAVFTSISMDHMDLLGDSFEEIAENKSGIIKERCSVISAPQKPSVLDLLKEKAAAKGCPFRSSTSLRTEILEESWEGQSLRIYEEAVSGDDSPAEKSMDIWIALAGRHQSENAAVTLSCVRELNRRGFEIGEDEIVRGFGRARWPGRFSCISKKPLFIVDGAHNLGAAQRLRESAEQYLEGKKLTLIISIFKDKDYEKVIEIMAPLASHIIVSELPDQERTLDAAILREEAAKWCSRVEAAKNLEDAVEKALDAAGEEDAVLAFGSLSGLGRIIQAVQKRNM